MVVVRKLHEHLLADLLAAIFRGDYPEGAQLPKETELAATFQVSRYVVRECIHALRGHGVVTVTHGIGQFVAPRAQWDLFDPVLLDAIAAGPDADQAAAEARETITVVWPNVAALAAKRRTNAHLTRLDRATDAAALRMTLADAAGNRFLRHVVATLERLPDVEPSTDVATYLPVLEAIQRRDPDAARAAMTALAGRWTRPAARRKQRT